MRNAFETNDIDVGNLEKKLKSYTHSIMNDYDEQNKEQINKLFQNISKDFNKLKEEINYEKLNNEVQKTLDDFKKNYLNSVQKSVDETLEIVKQLEELNVTNFEVIKNEEIRLKFEEAFNLSVNEIDIISPWITNYVLYKTGVYKYIQGALRKGVKVKILYGIGKNENSDNEISKSRGKRSEEIAQKLEQDFQIYGHTFKIKKRDTHSKILICDNKFAIIGSYNFLSFSGEYEKDTRDEIAAVTTDLRTINKLRTQEFDF
jgi:phosphatidylserine/phosphatidylglycerophosphate/cardiolipin synthase-like enzyme